MMNMTFSLPGPLCLGGVPVWGFPGEKQGHSQWGADKCAEKEQGEMAYKKLYFHSLQLSSTRNAHFPLLHLPEEGLVDQIVALNLNLNYLFRA